MRHHPIAAVAVVTFALAAGCGRDSAVAPSDSRGPQLSHVESHWTAWSEPVHIGPPVSSPARELGARLSPDELSLYFGSDRMPGGFGGIDIWVSRRACLECPWETPVNLGAHINSPGGDGAPVLSGDGHLLFFSGSRADGGAGGEDIWVSFRANPKDDLGWEPPMNLGPLVNTASDERGPAYVPVSHGRGAELYFGRDGNLYRTRITRGGVVLEQPVQVSELNAGGAPASETTIRHDGLELMFWSTRTGGHGATDIWVATREHRDDPWSAPRSLDPPVNTEFGELTPGLSHDGRSLFFSGTATRGASLGRQDIWMTTRTRTGGGER